MILVELTDLTDKARKPGWSGKCQGKIPQISRHDQSSAIVRPVRQVRLVRQSPWKTNPPLAKNPDYCYIICKAAPGNHHFRRRQMKKIIGLMFLLSLVFLIPNLTADDYLLTANPDYYNPFALSFNYRLKPAIPLKNTQFLRLRYTIDDLRTSKSIIGNDIIVDAGAEIYDIYFFLRYDEKNKNINFSVDIPYARVSSNIGFRFPDFTSGDIGYEKKIDGDFGKKYHLMSISPLEGKIMIGNLHHKNFSYKKASFPPLKIYITITKHAYAVGSSPKSQPPPAPAVSRKTKDELIKEMQEVELKYRAGKASFAELSQARERLNEYLPKKLLTSLGVPNYLEQTKCNSDALAYQAELWNMKKKKFESGVIPLTDVLFEELRFIDILRKSQNLSESVKTQLIKEYSKRLDKIYSLKKAEFEAGILSSKEWTMWQKTVSDLKKAHNIK